MNIMKADKAPFILVLLLTALGWQASQFLDEVKSYRAAVSYEVERDHAENSITVSVRNESRVALNRADFLLECPDTRSCFVPVPTVPNAGPGFGPVPTVPDRLGDERPTAQAELRTTSAIAHNDGWWQTDEHRISYGVTLPPGGAFVMSGKVRPNREPVFLIVPESTSSWNVYVYDRDTLMGFVVGNYVALLAASLLLTLAALVAYVILSGVLRRDVDEDVEASSLDSGASPVRKPRKRRTVQKD